MKTNYIIFAVLFLGLAAKLQAQVGVNTTSPNSSSVLHIVGQDKPIMLPKISDPTLLNGNTKLKAGLFFDNRTGQKCLKYIQADGTGSGCILTTADVSTSNIQNQSSSTVINVSATTFTNLLPVVTFTASTVPRRIFISADIMRQVTVATVGNCASLSLQIVLTNTTDGTSTVVSSDTAQFVPRVAGITDIYPVNSKMVYTTLQKNKVYTISYQYKKNSGCGTPTTDQIINSNLTAAAY